MAVKPQTVVVQPQAPKMLYVTLGALACLAALVLGAVLMMVMRVRNPAFFEGKTLNRDTEALRDENDLSVS